jgi:beta/gamma crystallin
MESGEGRTPAGRFAMRKGLFRCLGFAATAALSFASASLAQVFPERQMGGIGITVFRDENFRGRSATFRQDVPDLRQYDLNDRITSLTVAPGEYWEACESPNYQGRCVVFSAEERDLRSAGWSDKISSLRRVRREGGSGGGYRPPLGKFGVILYDEPFFRGRSVSIKDSVDNLRSVNFHDRAESVRVVSGTWELCAEPRFRRCQTVSGDVPNLSALGLNKKLSSARAAAWDGGGGPAYPEEARAVLFEEPGYRGRSITLDGGSSDLGGFGGRARSIQVISGRWLLCDRARFAGRCQEISQSVPDLDRWSLGGVMSARPVDRY